ncbi:hypothetical protein J4412_01925 [Candidatus Pacearchaeota archaeon]|nr:MAG: hypothetical protein QJ16_C0019G0008 [archaeon GW2011_AR1]MBS3078242.1 hypothetical protein [Candidatus Pacearchaeota archaeon]HBD95044.1 hypothetical protein [Spirochaetia bacterium]HIH52113.1 hypothetical protein [Nanoarchaeota archaeon]
MNKNYNWESLVSEKKKNKSYENREGFMRYYGAKSFAKKFTPRRGLLGILSRKKKAFEDTLKFLTLTGLVENEEQGKKFIEDAKKRIYIASDEVVSYVTYLELKEFVNSEGKKSYIGRVKTHHRSCP